ncbi:MAG: hypothetical protein J7L38_08210 [Thermoproteales archaeon]|nr:hypothetical protein [Thermoproteales archaeon]
MNTKVKVLVLVSVLVSFIITSSLIYAFLNHESDGKTIVDKEYSTNILDRIEDFIYEGKEGEVVEINPKFPKGVRGVFIPPFKRFSLAKGVEEILKIFNGNLPLFPRWLPERMKYASVFIGPVIVICFSDRFMVPEKEFMFANVSIEVTRMDAPPEMLLMAPHRGRILKIDSTWVVLATNASTGFWEVENVLGERPLHLAYFIKDGFHYLVSIEKPLTPQDLLRIVESMLKG